MGAIKKYSCIKIVRAIKIAALAFKANGYICIVPKDTSLIPFSVPPEWAKRCHYREHNWDTGYYVIYKNGYTSWLPTEVFEQGYAEID